MSLSWFPFRPRTTPARAARAVALRLALVASLPAALLASDGVEPISVSHKALARGGADVAVGDSALSQIDNPATLALAPRQHCTFDTSAEIAILRLQWTSPVDSSVSTRSVAPLLNSALAVPVNDRLTVGAAVHSKAGFSSAYDARHVLIPFMLRRVSSDLKVVSFPLNAAYKLTDRLSLGIGARAELATAEFSTVLGPADVELSRGYACGGGFQLGLHYRARADLSFGLAYRSPTWFNDLRGGDAKASLLGVLPIALGSGSIEDLRFAQRIAAGAAWDPSSWLKLVSEVRWLNYSSSTLHSTTIATNGLVDLRYPLPLGYRDQWAFMTGGEFKLREHWKLGVGYHYATPAVPRTNLLPVASVIATHHATVGLRYETERWWAGAGYVIGFPETLRGNGCSHIPLGVDYGLSSLRQTQHAISIGFGFNW